MRDFRIPNVLTHNGAEGSYVIVDLEFAGPDKHPWTLDYLQDWDHHTLNQVKLVMRSYNLTECDHVYWFKTAFLYVDSLGTSAVCAC